MHLGAVRQQIASAIHIIVQAARLQDGSRRVISITEVTGMEADVVTLQEIFVFQKMGLARDGKVAGRFAGTGIVPRFSEKLAAAGIRIPARLFQETATV
jgi:pilus assembly protein CpaF